MAPSSKTVHSQQDGLLWLTQVIVISHGTSTKMNCTQILVNLEIYYAYFLVHLYLVFILQGA